MDEIQEGYLQGWDQVLAVRPSSIDSVYRVRCPRPVAGQPVDPSKSPARTPGEEGKKTCRNLANNGQLLLLWVWVARGGIAHVQEALVTVSRP